jgi:hypothetical protein
MCFITSVYFVCTWICQRFCGICGIPCHGIDNIHGFSWFLSEWKFCIFPIPRRHINLHMSTKFCPCLISLSHSAYVNVCVHTYLKIYNSVPGWVRDHICICVCVHVRGVLRATLGREIAWININWSAPPPPISWLVVASHPFPFIPFRICHAASLRFRWCPCCSWKNVQGNWRNN